MDCTPISSMPQVYDDVQWNSAMELLLCEHFPIHRACRDGDEEALRRLLDNNRSIGIITLEDSFYGWTAIHWAAYFGHLACLRILTQHASGMYDQTNNPQMLTTKHGQSPVHLAAFGGSVACLKWLIDSGYSVAIADYLGETPAHKAARTGCFECLSLLVINGVDLSSRNSDGATAAELAKKFGHDNMCAYMNHAAYIQENYDKKPTVVSGAYGFIPTTTTAAEAVAVPQPLPTIAHSSLLPSTSNNNGLISHHDSNNNNAVGDLNVRDVLSDVHVTANVVAVGGRKRAYRSLTPASKRMRIGLGWPIADGQHPQDPHTANHQHSHSSFANAFAAHHNSDLNRMQQPLSMDHCGMEQQQQHQQQQMMDQQNVAPPPVASTSRMGSPFASDHYRRRWC